MGLALRLQLRSEQLTNLSVDDFVGAIGNFKRRTQTAMALRFLLKERGVAIAPFSLAVPQESIFDHIEALKEKEKGCVKQIRKEIVSIIKDSDVMIQSASFTEGMRKDILKVRQAMQVNLEHLDSGGSVSDIPNVFETVVMQSVSAEPIVMEELVAEFDSKSSSKPVKRTKTAKEEAASNENSNKAHQAQDKAEPKTQNKAEPKTQNKAEPKTQNKPESFWGLVKIWLASPWNVSWRSIKKDSKK